MNSKIDLSMRDVAVAAINRSNRMTPAFRAVDTGPPSPGRRWHVVHVAARFERQAADETSFVSKLISDAGFELYSAKQRRMIMPRSNQLTASQRKHRHLLAKEKIEPMFPGYEFVRFDIEADHWHELFKIVGIHGMLCENNLPAPLPAGFVENLKAKEVDGAIPAKMPALDVFGVGEIVRVSKPGSLAGLTGPIEKLDDAGRIRLLLGFFGGSVPAELTVADIEKL